MNPIEQLPQNKKHVKLPNNKSSIYELSRRECERYYNQLVIIHYPQFENKLMREYHSAVKNEPGGLDGIRVQLSSLMAYWFYWI